MSHQDRITCPLGIVVPNTGEVVQMETVVLSHDSLSNSPVVGGNGSFSGSRRVWAYDFEGKPAVVKHDGYNEDNVIEVMIWERVKGTPIADLFAEIYAHTDTKAFIVMERADKVLNVAADIDVRAACMPGAGWRDETYKVAWQRVCDRLVRECWQYGIVARDLHEGNFGIRANGELCVIDYGNFEIRNVRYNGRPVEDSCPCPDCMASKERRLADSSAF